MIDRSQNWSPSIYRNDTREAVKLDAN